MKEVIKTIFIAKALTTMNFNFVDVVKDTIDLNMIDAQYVDLIRKSFYFI